MWLIDTNTLQLQFFLNTDDVKYAILSHRWQEDEVTLDEFRDQTPEIRAKKGYDKIAMCCRRARLIDGLSWAWVDTCCIDKRSSAELQEAINSMFNWYQAAHVCYVYLCDIHELMPPSIPFFECVRHSEWFTRA